MELLERDRHDHPDFDQLLPQVGCLVCGAAVQLVPEDREGARTAYQAVPEDGEAAELRQRFEAPMASWSFRHADTHTRAEHEAAAIAAGLR